MTVQKQPRRKDARRKRAVHHELAAELAASTGLSVSRGSSASGALPLPPSAPSALFPSPMSFPPISTLSPPPALEDSASADEEKAVKAVPKDPRGNVIAEYRVLIVRPKKHIMILSYPNRDRNQPYNNATGQKPLELRIKPKSGLVEVDIPIRTDKNYDHIRGVEYGQALKKKKAQAEDRAFGEAGGFGINAQTQNTSDEGQAAAAEATEEDPGGTSGAADEERPVMDKISLGGKILRHKNGQPMYCIGVFKGDELHLTPVDAMVMLQPNFLHLDSVADTEKAGSRAQRGAENPAPEPEARAVNMAAKSTDTEEVDMSDIAKELREMQEEPWQRLEWIDEDDTRAYTMYNKELFLPAAQHGPHLVSAMTNEQYLDAISAPRIDPSNTGRKVMMSTPHDDDETSDEESVESEYEEDWLSEEENEDQDENEVVEVDKTGKNVSGKAVAKDVVDLENVGDDELENIEHGNDGNDNHKGNDVDDADEHDSHGNEEL